MVALSDPLYGNNHLLQWTELPDQKDELADDIKKLREAGVNVIDGPEPGTAMIFFHRIRPGNELSEDEQEVPSPPHRKPN